MSGLVTPTLGGIDVLRLPCMPLVLRAALDRAGEGRNVQALADTVAQDPALAARCSLFPALRILGPSGRQQPRLCIGRGTGHDPDRYILSRFVSVLRQNSRPL